MPKVFISATRKDLKEYIEVAKNAALGAAFFPEMQEYFPAEGRKSLDACLAKVAESDVLLVIVAHRYGWVPEDQGGAQKVLVAAAHALPEIEIASTHGIEVGPAKLDWAKLIDREKAMIGFIPDAMRGVAERRGTVFAGTGRFVGPNAVEVDGTRLEAEHLVVATGSTPHPLPIPSAEHMI